MDTVDMCMKYLSMDQYMLDTLCKLVDICWDALNDIMSQYNSHYYHIFGLKGFPTPFRSRLSDWSYNAGILSY